MSGDNNSINNNNNSNEEGEDALAALVRRGLTKLRQGEFFTAYGLDENNLNHLLPLPNQNEKNAPLHVFLRAVSELSDNNEIEISNEDGSQPKKAKKIFKERLGELMRRRQEWVRLIEPFLEKSGDPISGQEWNSGTVQRTEEQDNEEGVVEKTTGMKKRRSSRQQIRPAETDDLDPDAQNAFEAQVDIVDTRSIPKKKRNPKRSLTDNDDAMDKSFPTSIPDGDEPPLDPKSKVAKKRRISSSTISKTDDSAKNAGKKKLMRGYQQPKKKAKQSKVAARPVVSQELLARKRNEVKAEFEARKKEILDELPIEVKKRFKQLGFVKWNGKAILPVLILSPFDVPPGPVRQQWMKMFENCKKQNRLSEMLNIIFWYGTLNMDQAYSFEHTKNFVSYESGCKRGYDKLPARILKLVESGAPLKGRDLELYNGLQEIEEDDLKDPSERRRGILDFPEEYELINEDDINELEDEDEDMDDDDEEDSKEDVDSKVDVKPVIDPAKQVVDEKPTATVSEPAVKQPIKSAANDMADIGEAEISDTDALGPDSADDDYDFNPLQTKQKPATVNKKKRKQAPTPTKPMNENGTGEDNQDNLNLEPESLHKRKRPRKQGATGAKRKPTKDSQKKQAPTEAEPKPTKDSKKAVGKTTKTEMTAAAPEKRSKQEEQQLFVECQDLYLPLIEKWRTAIDENNVDALTGILEELVPLVDKFSASFFEAYRLNEMMKPKTREIVKENEVSFALYNSLWNKMKTVYKEKKGTMPVGFVANKRPPGKQVSKNTETKPTERLEPSTSKRALVDSRENLNVKQRENLAETTGAEATSSSEVTGSRPSSVPRKRSNEDESSTKQSRSESSCLPGQSSQVSQVAECKSPTRTTPQAQVASVKPEKKKFSLGNLMRPKEAAATSTSERRSSGDESKVVSSDRVAAKRLPDWMTKPPRVSPPSGRVRSFGHEFLIQAAGLLPEDVVNVDSVALDLEDAIYQYATDKTNDASNEENKEDAEAEQESTSASWVKTYWKMVYLLVAAISGKYDRGSLHPLLLSGTFASASDVVKIPETNLRRAFDNLPFLDHVKD